jgi:ABC-type glycerol-3-phosphate transport system substrate-binding protein
VGTLRHDGLTRIYRRAEFSRRKLLGSIGAAALVYAGKRLPRAEASQSATLRVWAASGQRWEFANRGIAPLFEKAHPGVKVEVTGTPIANYGAKVAAAMAAGAAQWDVIQLDYAQLPQFGAARWVHPLDDWIKADAKYRASLSDIPPRVLALYNFKGVQYGVPADSNAMMTYYRADVLSKYGMKPPATWEDAIAIAKELHSKSGKQYGYVGSLGRGLFAYLGFAPVIWSYGGEMWDERTFEVKVDKGDAGFKALTVLRELVKYGDPVSVGASDDEVNSSMASGTSVMAPSAWGNSVMTNKNFSKYWEVIKTTIVPSGAAGRHVPAMGGLGHMVVERSQNKDLAWQYVKFVTGPDPNVGKAWVLQTGQPARLSLLLNPELDKFQSYFPTLAETLKIARRYGGGIPEAYAIGDVIGTDVSAIITGQMEIQPGLKKLGDSIFNFLKTSGYPAQR